MHKLLLLSLSSSTLVVLLAAGVAYAFDCDRGCKEVLGYTNDSGGSPCFWALGEEKLCVDPISAPGADPNEECGEGDGDVLVYKVFACSVFCLSHDKPWELGSTSGSNEATQTKHPVATCEPAS